MNPLLVTGRLGLLLGLLLTSTTAFAATPPPNYSGRVYLCHNRLFADVRIDFANNTSTATVRATGKPVKINPSAIGYTPWQTYIIRATAAVKNNSNAQWSAVMVPGEGTVGVTQDPVSSGHSTFRNEGCEIKGTVWIFTLCPPEAPIGSDVALIERNWVGCGA